jgi:hypothetical protein
MLSSTFADGGQADSKTARGDHHRHSANGEDIASVQIVALILHFLASDLP